MTKTYTKRLGILRKKEGMTDEQFVDHWLNTHAVLCTEAAQATSLFGQLVDRARFPKFGYDGFSELWFDSEEDLVARWRVRKARRCSRICRTSRRLDPHLRGNASHRGRPYRTAAASSRTQESIRFRRW